MVLRDSKEGAEHEIVLLPAGATCQEHVRMTPLVGASCGEDSITMDHTRLLLRGR